MKRFLAIILSALLVLTTLAVPVMAEDELLIEVIGEDLVEEGALEEEGDENDLALAEVTEEPEEGQIEEIKEIDEIDEIEEEMSMDPDDPEDGSEESDISLEESQGEWEELLEEHWDIRWLGPSLPHLLKL